MIHQTTFRLLGDSPFSPLKRRRGPPAFGNRSHYSLTPFSAISHARANAFTAYACSYAPYCSEATFKRLRMAVDTTATLQSDASWASRLYNHVKSIGKGDVAIESLELEFGFQLAPVTRGGYTSDPYFSRVLEQQVATSLATFLQQLDQMCRSLPGLDPAELSAEGDDEVRAKCNQLYNRLGPELVRLGATDESLLQVAEKARHELVAEATRLTAARLGYQAGGVRALQRLCAAAINGTRDVGAIIDRERDAIGYVIRYTPVWLKTELDASGISLAELGAYLYPVEVHRMCGAVLEMSVSRWAATHYEAVSAACVNTLNEMRHQSQVGASWHGYVGVAFWHAQHQRDLITTAIATGGVGAAMPCPEMAHTHALKDWVLVATATTQNTALRVARIAAVVHEAVRLKVLRPRVVRSENLLAFFSRFACEREFELDRTVADEMDVESTSTPLAQSLVVVAPPPVPQAPVVVGSPPTTLMMTLRDTTRVPKSLQRDYVLLSIMRDQLAQTAFVMVPGPETDDESQPTAQVERGYLGIGQACDRMKSLADIGEPVTPMIERFTKASLTMTMGHVMHDKCVKLLQMSRDDLDYTTMPSNVSGTKGMAFSRMGARELMKYLNSVIQKMQAPSGAAFANEWHTSRSAKSHARRKQVQPGVGGNLEEIR